MFDSEVTALDFIDALKSEADIAPNIPDTYFIDWLNNVEQTLYDNIIKQETTVTDFIMYAGDPPDDTDYRYEVMTLLVEDCAPVRFEDIVSVAADGRQFARVSQNVGVRHLFPFTYWSHDNTKFTMYAPGGITNLTVVLQVRPLQKTSANISTSTVKVPIEFIDMVRAKLRGEAYKFANEDALAAKWLADYNAQLEYFRAWVASKLPTFGA